MRITFEWLYSHITWILYILLFLFIGSTSIGIYQLNNYNHTVANVLARNGGVTEQAQDNLEHEVRGRYGKLFYVTTRDGKRTGPQVNYGDQIEYTIHPKWAFFNSFAGIRVDRSVQSDVRKNVSPAGRSLDYGQDTAFYKQLSSYSSKPDNKTSESEVNPSLYIENLGAGDSVALVGTSIKKATFDTVAKQVAKGDLSGLSSSAINNLNNAKSVLTQSEANELYTALTTNAKIKQDTYAAFAIKHPDSTSKTPDYELAIVTFKPTGAFEFKNVKPSTENNKVLTALDRVSFIVTKNGQELEYLSANVQGQVYVDKQYMKSQYVVSNSTPISAIEPRKIKGVTFVYTWTEGPDPILVRSSNNWDDVVKEFQRYQKRYPTGKIRYYQHINV